MIRNGFGLFTRNVRCALLTISFSVCLLLLSCSNPSRIQQFRTQKHQPASETALNLNLATAGELEKLPKIGKGIARRIIEYREKYGKFARAEHLILVRGMSDQKFREIQGLIIVE